MYISRFPFIKSRAWRLSVKYMVWFSKTFHKFCSLIQCNIPDVLCWYLTSTAVARCHGPLTRYAKLRVAYAPGMLGTFSLADVMHVRFACPGSAHAISRIWQEAYETTRRMNTKASYEPGKYGKWNYNRKGENESVYTSDRLHIFFTKARTWAQPGMIWTFPLQTQHACVS